MHTAVAIIFAVFATVQYNDPDFFLWMPAYLLVSALVLLFGSGKITRRPFLMAALGYGAWMLSYVPEVISWVQEGLPSIAGSMQAESPFIEFVREFFGLAICMVTCLIYWRRGK